MNHQSAKRMVQVQNEEEKQFLLTFSGAFGMLLVAWTRKPNDDLFRAFWSCMTAFATKLALTFGEPVI